MKTYKTIIVNFLAVFTFLKLDLNIFNTTTYERGLILLISLTGALVIYLIDILNIYE